MSLDTDVKPPRRSPFRSSPEHAAPARPPSRRGKSVGDLVVGFEPGSPLLPDAQRQAGARWVRGWQAAQPRAVVVLAHDVGAGPDTRLARLRTLSDTIEGLGVPRDNLRYADLAASAIPAGDAGPAAADAVMLSMVESAARPRAVASCGADDVSAD